MKYQNYKNKLYFNSNKLKQVYKYCRACSSKNIIEVLSLAKTPLEDQFLKKKTKQHKYSLRLFICKECKYVFLNEILSENSSYKYYLYNSEVTLGLKKHYEKYASKLISKNKLNKNDLVIDIGSNDGTFLKFFKNKKIRVLGVEPAKGLVKIAKKKKINCFNDFFNMKSAEKILLKYGEAETICSNFTFANVRDINDFILGVNLLLKDSGTLVIETGYYPAQFKINMFDYIYHEHYSYYSITFLNTFFKRFNMQIIDIEETRPKGGSIRIYIKKINDNDRIESIKLKKYLILERQRKIFTLNYFRKFKKRIKKQKILLRNFLFELKDKNNLIGYGASHSTTVLLHHFDIGKNIKYLVDDNKIKHNLYSPGYHLKVYPSKKIKGNKYVLILAWQHAKSIIERNKNFRKNFGRFIVPLPKFKII